MAHPGIPIVILAGSDRAAVALPPAAAREHPLTGYKGIDLRFHGQPLIATVIARLRTCPAFGSIWVAGPRRVYQSAVGASTIIDTDGNVAENLRAAVACVGREPSGPVAFTTCDILPDPVELDRVLEHYLAQPPCSVWYPLIRAPEDRSKLAAFAWKPEYSLVLQAGAAAVRVLPGHLLIAELPALRLALIYRLLAVAYRTRNRPITVRRRAMVQGVLGQLVLEDLRQLATLRLPRLTWTVLRHGLWLARELRAGTMLQNDLERAVGAIVVKDRYRARFPERGVRLPVLDALSLAEDVDTEEEARQCEVSFDAARGGTA